MNRFPSLSTQCLGCGTKFSVASEGSGGMAKCPGCGLETVVLAPGRDNAIERLKAMGTTDEEIRMLEEIQRKIDSKRERE